MQGYEVKFGARAVVFYPLSLAQLRDFAKEVALFSQVDPGNIGPQFEGMLRVFLASAQRGNPAVNADDVAAVVDMENLFEVMKVVMGKRAFQLSEGEANPTGPRIGGTSSPA